VIVEEASLPHSRIGPRLRARLLRYAWISVGLFEPTAETIRQWIKQAALGDCPRSDGLTTSEREELNRLRREIRVLREEREILEKAAAWFAKETGATPKRRSNS
jgi:transposase-like protein